MRAAAVVGSWVALVVLVWLAYFVVTVALRLDVWPFGHQMRSLALALFVVAAFDWPAPWLDRAGAALLGLGLLVLAGVPPARPLRRRIFGPRLPASLDGAAPIEPVTRDLVRAREPSWLDE